MNIILLSGGSGKRLWPLSNDVRSKQFIKLFKNGEEYESMVQRVYRQITTVDAGAKITIATSKSQASAIKNQLGEKASICVEPCRRDTFPAIALAAAYLHDELGVAENEAVVVCPVDPYVDNTYYEAVKNLQELAEQGGANLTLMGIEPTVPSEKYGYIIPESGENVSKVIEFKEKPDKETAKKYLAQSALWNAGIFAFKLGYLLDKAHSMIEDLRQRQKATNRRPAAILAIMKNDPGAFRADLGYFRTSPTKPYMGPSVRNAPPFFQAHVLKGSPMIDLGGTSAKSKGFLVKFKSGHVGMVQRQLGVPTDKDYTESGKKRWKPNEKLATLSSPSGSAMHHTVWEMQEQTVEQMLQQNTERRVRQLIANAKRKGVI